MRLTLKIKLLPSTEQHKLLFETLKDVNLCCNDISYIAWSEKVFNQFKIHHKVYHSLKSIFPLSAQLLVRCISKVADAYKMDRNTKKVFKHLGSIAYDSRILTYKPDDKVSIWAIGGRIVMPFVCHNRHYLSYIKGESDLVYKNGKFYLFQSIEVPDTDIKKVEEFIGVDFGVTDIAVTSDGVKHSAEWINTYREKQQKIRSSIQSKGTRSSRRLLKRISGRERTTATIINHTISKSIVEHSKKSNKGISIEDLTNIKTNPQKKNKKFNTKLARWSFHQLRTFISYKCAVMGIRMVVVNPAYTSKSCSNCHRIGNRSNKSFKCKNCGHNEDADFNASKNIATLGAVINQPEKSIMYSCALHS